MTILKNISQKIILVFLLLCMTNFLIAQVPKVFRYQAVARNTTGLTINNQNIKVRISLLPVINSSASLYTETRSITTNDKGLFTVNINSAGATNVTGVFNTIDWSTGKKFIKIEIDPLGNTNYTDLGTNELLTVPYALFADNSFIGPQGLQGEQGLQGAQGIQGPQGLTGLQGLQGLQGFQGVQGLQGGTGLQGVQGLQGLQGTQGTQGMQGVVGTTGKNNAILTSTEPAGVNCIEGGIKQQYGLDANSNGSLDASEIDAALTKYICNGTTGIANSGWNINGNNNATAGSFIGTTDSKPFIVKTNNVEVLKIETDSTMYIGGGNNLNSPFYKSLNVVGSKQINEGLLIEEQINANNEAERITFSNNSITATKQIGTNELPAQLTLQPNGGNVMIGSTTINPPATLTVNRGVASGGTAIFRSGTINNYNSVFNEGASEHTTINSGAEFGDVTINNIFNGSVFIGGAAGSKINMKSNIIADKGVYGKFAINSFNPSLNLVPFYVADWDFYQGYPCTPLASGGCTYSGNLPAGVSVHRPIFGKNSNCSSTAQILADDYFTYTLTLDPTITAGYTNIIAKGQVNVKCITAVYRTEMKYIGNNKIEVKVTVDSANPSGDSQDLNNVITISEQIDNFGAYFASEIRFILYGIKAQ